MMQNLTRVMEKRMGHYRRAEGRMKVEVSVEREEGELTKVVCSLLSVWLLLMLYILVNLK